MAWAEGLVVMVVQGRRTHDQSFVAIRRAVDEAGRRTRGYGGTGTAGCKLWWWLDFAVLRRFSGAWSVVAVCLRLAGNVFSFVLICCFVVWLLLFC